jgi:hypothetical protein
MVPIKSFRTRVRMSSFCVGVLGLAAEAGMVSSWPNDFWLL